VLPVRLPVRRLLQDQRRLGRVQARLPCDPGLGKPVEALPAAAAAAAAAAVGAEEASFYFFFLAKVCREIP